MIIRIGGDSRREELLLFLRHRATAMGMTELSHQSGISRVQLYEILSPSGNPKLESLMKIVKALELDILIG